MRHLYFALLLAPIVFLNACASTRPAPPAHAATVDPRMFTLLDGHTGRELRWSDLIARAAAADAVFIGESHAPGPTQAFHGPFYSDLLAAAPAAAAALEFYERDHQADVDDYLSGVTDWPQLVKAVFANPASDLEGHRAIVQASKTASRPVAAANAPRRYATLARREGYPRLATLSAEQRRLFAVPSIPPSERYRSDFFSEMGVDLADPATSAEDITRIDAMFRAQSLWDATMAESVSRLIDAGAHPAVLVVGRFHTDFEGGLIQQFRAKRSSASVLTISLNVLEAPPSTPATSATPQADVIIYAQRQ